MMLKFTSFLIDADTTFFCSESFHQFDAVTKFFRSEIFLTSAIDTGPVITWWYSVARPKSFSIIEVAGTEFLLTVAALLVILWAFRSSLQV